MRRRNSRRRSMNPKMARFVIIVTAIALAIAAIDMWARPEKEKPIDVPAASQLLTVLSDNGQPSQLLYRKAMTISFNEDLHIPNWVAWELTREDTNGTQSRSNNFQKDPYVDASATPGDYKMSGYDRGHMAPAGDMKKSYEAMSQSFWMTNIVPQTKRLNTGTWRKLEEKCRLLANIDSAIYIVCGPVLTDEPREYIGMTRVAVPRRFFKVVLSPYAAGGPQGIGFIMDNNDNPGGLQQTAVTIDHVEAVTGLDFFSQLPDSIENVVESQCNFNRWSNRARR